MNRREMLLGFLYLAFQQLFLPSLLVRICARFFPLNAAWLNFVYYAINFIVIVVVFHRFLLESLDVALGRKLWILRCLVLGFCGYFAISNIWGSILNYYFPGFSNVNDDSIGMMLRQDMIPMVIGTVLLVPIAEETLFRGLIFRGLYKKSKVLAFLVSVAAFSAIHVIGYIGSYDAVTLLVCFTQYFPASICLAWVYAESDTIISPILMHTLINLAGVLLSL